MEYHFSPSSNSLQLSGSLSIDIASKLYEVFKAQCMAPGKTMPLTVDITDVSHMDTACAQVMLAFSRCAVDFRIVGASTEVMTLIKAIGLQELLNISRGESHDKR